MEVYKEGKVVSKKITRMEQNEKRIESDNTIREIQTGKVIKQVVQKGKVIKKSNTKGESNKKVTQKGKVIKVTQKGKVIKK